MTAKLLLGLLLTTALTAAAAPQPAEDPCALARRIAQSPPCLAGSACEALDLWRQHFGRPDVVPVDADLPPDLVSRLPDADVALGRVSSYEDAFRRLGEVSGVEVVLHPGLKREKVAGQIGPMPVERAWRILLGLGSFQAHFDGERVLVAQAPSDLRRPLRGRSRTNTCPVR